MTTTIQIKDKTKQRLDRLKRYPRETYDDLVSSLLSLVPEGDDEGKYSEAFRLSLLRGTLDIKEGKTYSSEEVRNMLGLK